MTHPVKPHPWSWFTDKVLPPVFAALAIGAITSGVATYQSIQVLTSKVEQTDKDVAQLKARIEAVSVASVTRSEMLETMKRVELQLELMMARAGIKK
jgi:hypothetical protein